MTPHHTCLGVAVYFVSPRTGDDDDVNSIISKMSPHYKTMSIILRIIKYRLILLMLRPNDHSVKWFALCEVMSDC